MREIEKTILDLLASGMKVNKIAKTVGHCERQVYRIKKKLKERMQDDGSIR